MAALSVGVGGREEAGFLLLCTSILRLLARPRVMLGFAYVAFWLYAIEVYTSLAPT
jgi:hypothetical protein